MAGFSEAQIELGTALMPMIQDLLPAGSDRAEKITGELQRLPFKFYQLLAFSLSPSAAVPLLGGTGNRHVPRARRGGPEGPCRRPG